MDRVQALRAAAVAVALTVTFGGTTTAVHAAPPELTRGPLIIAHRAGTGDFPENTLVALDKAVEAGVDGVWLTVQVSSDGVPVLYRPADLTVLTDGSGPVNSLTAQRLQQLNAGWNFTGDDGGHPYREQPTYIPSLAQAILATPPAMPLFLDLKQTPAQPLVSAVAQVLRETGAARRSVVYSTDADITAASVSEGLEVAESRDATRLRLLNMAMNGHCDPAPDPGKWAGFEMHRNITVTEKFTLGVGISPVNAELWDPASVECFTAGSDMKVIGFAVNSLDDYQLAQKAGMDAVLVDSPVAAQQWRGR
jgi:glycerophosphoryl diester phosphodiesterase